MVELSEKQTSQPRNSYQHKNETALGLTISNCYFQTTERWALQTYEEVFENTRKIYQAIEKHVGECGGELKEGINPVFMR